jgi:hypothetical protein
VADITNRANKKVAPHLEAGEAVRVAVLVESKGTYGLGSFGLAPAPRTTSRMPAETQGSTQMEEGGMAAAFPLSSAVIAVTNRWVRVSPSNGLSFGAPVLSVPIGSLPVRSIEAKGLGRPLELAFSDGSRVTVDAQRGQPFEELVAALGTVP